jgi:phosphomannomutase
MNRVVLRETAAGLADAMKQQGDLSRVAVVYDTRHSSREFAYLVSAQLAAYGHEVILVDGPRPTPLLSHLVRRRQCGAGIVISASHNPPQDNGIKIYGPDGAQVLGERDARLMECIRRSMREPDRIPSVDLEALARWELPDRVEVLDPVRDQAEVDAPYRAYVADQSVSGSSLAESGLRVAFSPLHGVGHHALVPLLRERGAVVHAVERQCDPDDGQFSTVESANPESPAAMAMAVELAREHGADLALATDPDADRLGACVRDDAGEYVFIDGNRLGVLMLDHVLSELDTGPASPEMSGSSAGWVLTTMVTSPLVGSIAEHRGVEVVSDLLVGFKHHAGMMAESDRPMIFACEESHGYLRGNDICDKDGAIAALLLCECAAVEKSRGRTLHDRLQTIWKLHGYHREQTRSLYAHGAAGRQAIGALMDAWREEAPPELAGLGLRSAEDRAKPRNTGSPTRDLLGNVLCFEFEGGGQACRVVVRPSGTEPKVKIYALARGADPAQVDGLVERVLTAAEQRASAVMAPLLARTT